MLLKGIVNPPSLLHLLFSCFLPVLGWAWLCSATCSHHVSLKHQSQQIMDYVVIKLNGSTQLAWELPRALVKYPSRCVWVGYEGLILDTICDHLPPSVCHWFPPLLPSHYEVNIFALSTLCHDVSASRPAGHGFNTLKLCATLNLSCGCQVLVLTEWTNVHWNYQSWQTEPFLL